MPASNGNIQVVNELGLEEYLYGVLPKEVPLGWPEEVLKAQAVAARTYTVANLSKWQKYSFDIDSNSSDQIYQGFDVENANTNRAVDETRGEVLYFEGKPIIAFYHSDSGGQTENCQDVFGSDLPYLQSVDDLFYANSPNSKWEVQLSLNDISKKVNLSTPGLGEVCKISIIERSPTGRVKKILLKGNLGENIVENNEIRSLFGIKSNFFDIFGGSSIHLAVVSTDDITRNIELQNQCIIAQGGLTSFSRKTVSILGTDISKSLCYDTFSDTYIIQGRGYGHGVGMSQWGAKAMAENGYNYKEILLHYYKNVEIR
ncbi:MAG: SpoIID/LytB domain-containing protein [Tepidanaerobacteraceae bacterium]|nr:SpoIID/LytB domain-containing protein [Tepidanaerobacteraceae bacterium]